MLVGVELGHCADLLKGWDGWRSRRRRDKAVSSWLRGSTTAGPARSKTPCTNALVCMRKNLHFSEKVEFEAEDFSSKPGLYCGARRFSAGGAPPLVRSRVASTSWLALTNAGSFLGLGARLLLGVSGSHCLHTALRLLLGRAGRLCGAIRGAFTHCAVRLSRATALKVFKAMRYAGQARNPTLPLAMLAGLKLPLGPAGNFKARGSADCSHATTTDGATHPP